MLKSSGTIPLEAFRIRLQQPSLVFADTLAFIERYYVHTPSAFCNGTQNNSSEQNQGAAKVLGLALLEHLSLEETLAAFAEHYRAVLNTPHGASHPNIRALMHSGLAGVYFAQPPLQRR